MGIGIPLKEPSISLGDLSKWKTEIGSVVCPFSENEGNEPLNIKKLSG